MHVVAVAGTFGRVRIEQGIEFLGSKLWRIPACVVGRAIKRRRRAMTESGHKRSKPGQAEMVIWLLEIHRARDLGMHCGPTQLLSRVLLPDCRLHQCRSGQKEP